MFFVKWLICCCFEMANLSWEDKIIFIPSYNKK
jgi:hypothetical protein